MKYVIILIQIVFFTYGQDINCASGITSVTAVNSQAYKTDGKIQIDFTLLNALSTLTLTFPSKWSTSSILDPIQSTSACVVTSDATSCTKSGSDFSCPLLNTLLKVITCTNIVAPNTNQNVGDLKLIAGATTCNGIKVSNFQPYVGSLQFLMDSSVLTSISPLSGVANDELGFKWSNINIPIAMPTGTFIQITFIQNAQFKSTITGFQSSPTWIGGLNLATNTGTILRMTLSRAYVLNDVATFQISYAKILGNTQPVASVVEFWDATNTNLLYQISFPTISVQPGALGASLTIEQLEINTFSKYTFSLTTTNSMDSTASVRISLRQDSLTTISPTASCDGTSVTPTISLLTSPQYIEIAGCFTLQGVHTIIISTIKNPSSTASTIAFSYIKTYYNGYSVDENTSFIYSTPKFTQGLLAATYTRSGSIIVGGQSQISISITPKNEIPLNGRLIIQLPSEIEFITSGTYTCSPTCSVIDVQSNKVTLQFTQLIPNAVPLALTTNIPIRNPYDLSTCGNFKFSTFETGGTNIIDYIDTVVGFAVTDASSFDGQITISSQSEKNGATPSYTFILKIKTPQILPLTLKISTGDLAVINANPACSITGATLASCTRSTTTQISIAVSGTGLLAIGTTLTIGVASGSIQNKDSFQVSQPFLFSTETLNGLMSQQSGPTVQNTIVGDITLPTLSVDKQYYAATGATYTFGFQVSNKLQTGYYLLILAPFTIPSSGMNCKDGSNNLLICTGSTNIIKITGPFTFSGNAYTVIVSGLPTPQDSNAARTFTIKSYRTISAQDYDVDASIVGAFIFGVSCPSTNNCKTCDDINSTNPKCNSCYDSTISTFIYMKDQVCVSTCGDNYYQNDQQISSSPYTCLACPSNCKVCTLNNGSLICSKCITNYILQEANCVNGCGITYYQQSSTDLSCSRCDSICLTCSISSSNCQTCTSTIPWMNNKCYQYGCDNGYFSGADTSGKLICQACPTTCLICTASTQCSVCIENYYQLSGQCVATCPDAYYPTTEYKCLGCLTGCIACASQDTCIKCADSYFQQSSKCVTQCYDTFYATTDKVCTSCGGNCKTCKLVDTTTTCLTCVTNYFLILDTAACVKECPAQYYQVNDNDCLKCSTNCLTCKSTSDTCMSCSGAYPFLLGSLCVNDCGTGYYADTSSGSCIKCNTDCVACTSQSVCTTCNLTNQTLYLIEGACRTSCPENYQPNGLGCVLIPVQNLIPNRYVPLPFLIVEAFLGIGVIVSKIYRPETFIPAAFVGLAAIFTWGAWITLGLLYLFYYSYMECYYFWLLVGGVAANYVLNVVQVILTKKKIYSDPEFQRWKAASFKNQFSSGLFMFLSLFASFPAFRIVFSKYFGFTFFKAKLSDIKELFSFNLINGLSLVFVQIPIIIASGLIAYYEPTFDSQTFISAIDTAIVTILMMLFLLWETQKEDNYFDDTVSNYYSLNVTKLEKHQDSGIFNNTMQKIDESKQQIDAENPDSVQNKNILSDNVSRNGISVVVSDRPSIVMRDSAKLERFPYTTRPPPSNKAQSKHTIYFQKNNQVKHINCDNDEDEQNKDPNIEPPQIEQSDRFSSVKSQESDHGQNPFDEEPEPIHDISEIKDSDQKIDVNDHSQLSIFENGDQPFSNSPFKKQQTNQLKQLEQRSVLATEQAIEQIDIQWDDENDSQVLNIRQIESKEELHEQQQQQQSQQQQQQQQSQSKSNKQSLSEIKILSHYYSNETHPKSDMKPNQVKINVQQSKSDLKQSGQNSQSRSPQVKVQVEKQQIFYETPAKMNSAEQPIIKSEFKPKLISKSQDLSKQQQSVMQNQSFKIPTQHFDKYPSIPSSNFQPKIKNVNQEPSLPNFQEIEQFQLDVQNIDEQPKFTQNNEKTITNIPIVKDDNTIVDDDDPFHNNSDEPVIFNQKPKPYKMKVSHQNNTMPAIEKVFDQNDSIHTLTDQDWGENQISPSQFNSLNQRFEEDFIQENHQQNKSQDIQQQKQKSSILKQSQNKKQNKIQVIRQGSNKEQFDSDSFENQQHPNKEFSKNYQQSSNINNQKDLEKIYLQRLDKKQTKRKSIDNKLKPKDVSDAYLEVDVHDIQF